MMVVPAVSPATKPAVLTVPTAVLLLLHDPPDTASPSEVDKPVHTWLVPIMGVGAVATFTVAVTRQLALEASR